MITVLNFRFEPSPKGKATIPNICSGDILGESQDKKHWVVKFDNKKLGSIEKTLVNVLPHGAGLC
jgi:hypothetical protein